MAIERVAVSAGHYAEAPGACHDGFCEFPETTVWRALLASELISRGYRAEEITSGPLKHKVDQITGHGFDLAIEIHFNALPRGDGDGSESLYYPDSARGQRLARHVQDFLCDVFPPDRGIKPGYYWKDGAKAGVLYFLQATDCPALIVEPEFIRNRQKIQGHTEEACAAIADGIEAWVHEEAGR